MDGYPESFTQEISPEIPFLMGIHLTISLFWGMFAAVIAGYRREQYNKASSHGSIR